MTSINADLIGTAFVLSGYTASIDGSVANQLDVTAGRAYLVQADGHNDIGLAANGATTYLTTVPLTTYYLFLKNDGTWQWGTSSTPPVNSLAIAQATTDASANISGVTDVRSLNAQFLSGFSAAGTITFPGKWNTTGQYRWTHTLAGANSTILDIQPPDGGAKHYGLNYNTDNSLSIFNYTDSLTALKLTSAGALTAAGGLVASAGGVTATGASSLDGGKLSTDGSGNLSTVGNQATVGLGVPPVVARALDFHVTSTAQQTVLSYTATVAGWYRISAYVFPQSANPTVTLSANYTEPHVSSARSVQMIGSVVTAPQAGLLAGSNASAGSNSLSVAPILVQLGAAGVLTCTYQNSNGSPSDYITIFVERMA